MDSCIPTVAPTGLWDEDLKIWKNVAQRETVAIHFGTSVWPIGRRVKHITVRDEQHRTNQLRVDGYAPRNR